MSILRLARSELKRMTGGLLPKLTILALTMVPLLYGAVYLYANWDPYGKLNQIDAALVVEDIGAENADGSRLEAGRKVADNLVDSHVFNWQTVSDPTEADAGVSSGKYAFALKIPGDFSANLVSPGSFDAANQAMLNVTTNDANNYLLSTIVDKLTTAVHETVAKEVGEETANQLLTGFGTIHAQLVQAADGASRLSDGVATLHDGAAGLHGGTSELRSGAAELTAGQLKLSEGAGALANGAGQLSAGLGQLRDKTATLPADSQRLADGAAQVAAGTAALKTQMQGIAGQVEAGQRDQHSRLVQSTGELVAAGVLSQAQADKIVADAAPAPATGGLQTDAGRIQQLADGAAAVSSGAARIAGAAPALSDAVGKSAAGADQLASGSATLAAGARNAADGAGKLAAGTQKLDDGAAQLDSGSASAAEGARTLASELGTGAGSVPNPDDAQKTSLSKVIADPVAVSNVSQAKAGSYGAGLAPFFLTLALWIGIFMLVQAMRPLTTRALASNAPSWKIAVGGWIPFLVVSSVQASLLTVVVDVALGLDPAHPVLMWVLMLAAAMAFSALIQGLVALLGTPGKLVVLILLVLQLVSSGGTFPWQTTPQPLHVVHQVLPMGYVVTAMRHLIYGAEMSSIAPTLLGLVGYTVLGLALSTAAARKNKYWTLKSLKPEIAV